jgi:hypothetical protein
VASYFNHRYCDLRTFFNFRRLYRVKCSENVIVNDWQTRQTLAIYLKLLFTLKVIAKFHEKHSIKTTDNPTDIRTKYRHTKLLSVISHDLKIHTNSHTVYLFYFPVVYLKMVLVKSYDRIINNTINWKGYGNRRS